MSNSEKAIEITGLQLIDYLELEEQLPSGAIRKAPAAEGPGGMHGEPTLVTAIIILTAAAAHALNTWLSNRHSDASKESGSDINSGADGITMTISPDKTITIHMGSSGTSSDAAQKGELVAGIESVTTAILHAAEST
jgi:hypothetical protein